MKSFRLPTAALAATLLAPLAAADLTVTGQANYVDRAFTFNGGFTGAEPELPIRFADVRVINLANGQTLASSATLDDGSFSVVVPGSGSANIAVRILARTTRFGASARVTNSGNATYTVQSPDFNGLSLSGSLDVGTIVSQKLTANNRVGNPFNILDAIVDGSLWLESVGAGPLPVTVRSIWPGGSGSFAQFSTFTMADDDGYDDLVQLHEFGHVVHNLYSDSDSPGGFHTFGDSDQEPRLAFGEGLATAFAGAVRNFVGVDDPSFYLDALGTGATGPFTASLRMSMENGSPFANNTRGEANEGAVFCTLYDLVDTTTTLDGSGSTDDDPVDGSFLFNGGLTGDDLIWRSLTGPVATASNSTIRDMVYGLFTPGDPGFGDEIIDVFDGWRMRFFEDADEPNETQATAAPLQVNGGWSPIRTLYDTTGGAFAPGDGDRDFYAVEIEDGAVFSVETRYPNGFGDAGTYADPSLRVYRPDGSFFAIDDNSGVGRNALIADQTADQGGTWFVEVFTNDNVRRTGSYEVRVEASVDCNGNGVSDLDEIFGNPLLDIDQNGQLDACQSLTVDVASLGITLGGTQNLTLDAGPSEAGKFYWVLGTTSGTSPGLPLGSVTLPLNVDAYTNFLIQSPNAPPLLDGFGVLDAQGTAAARFELPAGSSFGLIGTVAEHAFVTINFDTSIGFASNTVPLIFTFF
ncbi:MAG: hypothetical protein AAFZ65_11030 [Planctomycetota bacterium]